MPVFIVNPIRKCDCRIVEGIPQMPVMVNIRNTGDDFEVIPDVRRDLVTIRSHDSKHVCLIADLLDTVAVGGRWKRVDRRKCLSVSRIKRR